MKFDAITWNPAPPTSKAKPSMVRGELTTLSTAGKNFVRCFSAVVL